MGAHGKVLSTMGLCNEVTVGKSLGVARTTNYDSASRREGGWRLAQPMALLFTYKPQKDPQESPGNLKSAGTPCQPPLSLSETRYQIQGLQNPCLQGHYGHDGLGYEGHREDDDFQVVKRKQKDSQEE